jgi:hypothetical protein
VVVCNFDAYIEATQAGEVVVCNFDAPAERNPRAMLRWDSETHEFWFGDKLLKRYMRPAARQELILAAFQEMGWPSHIEDPLPPGALRDTIRHLNDSLPDDSPIRFGGDGKGEGVFLKDICHTSATLVP